MKSMARIGYMAEHFVAADLIHQNYIPCMPTVPSSVFDIVAASPLHTIKVQVKSGIFKGNRLKIDLRRSKAVKRGYTPEDIDVFAILDRSSNKVAYLSIDEYVGKTSASLYLEEPNILSGVSSDFKPNIFDECTLEKALRGKAT